MRRKIVSLLLAGTMSLTMLAGCGASAESKVETNVETVVEEDSEEPVEEAKEEDTEAEEDADVEEVAADEDAGSEEMTEDEVIAALKEVLTIGYVGASTGDEEIYFASDDDVNKGILGIVDSNGEAMFLAGDIEEDADKNLTITDSESGDSLTFSIVRETDDEGEDYLHLTVLSNGAEAALYNVPAENVIDAMAEY
ncbi:MAG: hypothetical protein K5894_16135 [Lachnospiraceae bacterium]|nr:hypothetical protein [Lachnospiraceae bacterium]